MAKVINPLMSQDARGCVSGIHFCKNVSGNYVNPKCSPTRSQQPNAIAYRSKLGNAHHAFDALTDAQKATWDLTPDDRPKPREHFLRLYLQRAARGLTLPTAYPGDSGEFSIILLTVERGPPPLSIFYCEWLHDVGNPGWIDFVVRAESIRTYDGHPRKFHWSDAELSVNEDASFSPGPYGRYLTLQVRALDYHSLKLYHRWIYHFDGGDLVSVDPPPP